MHLLVELVLLVIGFAMLIKGADIFVEGAAGIAAKFGIPQLVIGLTIVAMGTSAPEAAVSITAAMKGTADITVGSAGTGIAGMLCEGRFALYLAGEPYKSGLKAQGCGKLKKAVFSIELDEDAEETEA